MDQAYLSTLKFPKKSHRKQIAIPSESLDLAELMGIAFGDGGINNSWQLVISLNSEADLKYSFYVKSLLEQLFKIEVVIRKRPRKKVLVLVCSSTDLVDFLVSKGSVRGNKVAQQIDVPGWIGQNEDFGKMFVRGLVDTDGCLYIHDHVVSGKRYKNLGFCFVSHSEPLIRSVANILGMHGVVPHISYGKKIYLYSARQVEKYLDIFGTSNPRIWNKYQEWTNSRKVANIST